MANFDELKHLCIRSVLPFTTVDGVYMVAADGNEMLLPANGSLALVRRFIYGRPSNVRAADVSHCESASARHSIRRRINFDDPKNGRRFFLCGGPVPLD